MPPKLTQRVEDLDLGIEEFSKKINTDLVGKVVNLASRVGKFAHQTGLATHYPDDDGGLFEQGARLAVKLPKHTKKKIMRKPFAALWNWLTLQIPS